MPEVVEKVSLAAKSLCQWCRAIHTYDAVARIVAPKKATLAEKQAVLDEEEEKLRVKQLELAAADAAVAKLQAKADETVAEKQRLADSAATTQKRLVRAGKLTTGLAAEQVRWVATVAELKTKRVELTGNVFVGAACIAYYGAFTAPYRQRLVARWLEACAEARLPVAASFSLIDVMAEQVVVREWQQLGLPVDDYSAENGILATRGKRWPLCIDPQAQANKWIKNMESRAGLRAIKAGEASLLRVLEAARC